MLRSFTKLNAVDLGFNPDGVAILYVQLTSPPTSAVSAHMMRDVESRVESELGVSATVITSAPIRPGGAFTDVHPEWKCRASPRRSRGCPPHVSPDFFEVFQIPLHRGPDVRTG